MEGDCTLPDDLVEDILSRLAVRDLLRCRSVSKQWRALIDSLCFIHKHYQVQFSIRMVNGNISNIVCDRLKKLHLLPMQQGDANTSDLTDDLEYDSKDMLPWKLEMSSGCVNGILCLTWKNRTDWKRILGLWNPATREYKAVAGPDMPCAVFEVAGFGFDPLSKDFKILGGYTLVGEDKWPYRCYEIYSLKTDSWKSLRAPPSADVRWSSTDGYLNGVFYWNSMLQQVNGLNGERLVIVSFSFSSEEFKVSDPPKDACLLTQTQICYPFQIMVTLYKESIALFINHEVQEKSASYRVDIWVVTHFDDCGVPLSWQHLFSIGPTPTGLGLWVVTTLINGDLILWALSCNGKCKDLFNCICDTEVECCIYKTSTSELKKLGKYIFSDYFRYVESLFPLSKRHLT